jgi:hypothetical protein
MKSKLQKERLIKFESLLDKIDSGYLIFTEAKPTLEVNLPSTASMTATLPDGSQVSCFYDLDAAVPCLLKSTGWHKIINGTEPTVRD